MSPSTVLDRASLVASIGRTPLLQLRRLGQTAQPVAGPGPEGPDEKESLENPHVFCAATLDRPRAAPKLE